jgi:hypothetical protein
VRGGLRCGIVARLDRDHALKTRLLTAAEARGVLAGCRATTPRASAPGLSGSRSDAGADRAAATPGARPTGQRGPRPRRRPHHASAAAPPNAFPRERSAAGSRPLREPYAGWYGLLLPCRGERNRVSFDAPLPAHITEPVLRRTPPWLGSEVPAQRHACAVKVRLRDTIRHRYSSVWKARRDIRWLVDARGRLVRQRVGLIPRWNGIGTILAEVELPAWREAGAGTASRWFIASRRRRVGVCQLSGELLELGRGRVALVATLERVEPAFAQRLVELEEQGGEVG